MSPVRIQISAHIAAPLARTWALYTDPAHIVGWNFASDDWCCPKAQVDLRTGGRHLARMEAKDGSVGFDFAATYDAVTPPNLLAMTLDDGRQVETRLDPTPGGTRLTTTFEAETENYVEMQRAGWQAILNNFKTYAEARPGHSPA